MGNIQRNKLIELGDNRNHYVDSNGIMACISATLYYNIEDEGLVLELTKLYKDITDKENKEHDEHIGYYRVGTLHKPEKRKISKILSVNKPAHRAFSSTGWHYRGGFWEKTLNQVLINVTEGNNEITRALKIAEIKKKLKK